MSSIFQAITIEGMDLSVSQTAKGLIVEDMDLESENIAHKLAGYDLQNNQNLSSYFCLSLNEIFKRPKPPTLREVLFQYESVEYIRKYKAFPFPWWEPSQNNSIVPILVILAFSEEEEILGEVAAHHLTPVWLLETLGRYRDPEIRGGVAINPATPKSLLRILLNDPDPIVKAYLAGNVSLQEDMAAVLMKEAVEIRMTLANNHMIGKNILEVLARDEDPTVANRARRSLGGLS